MATNIIADRVSAQHPRDGGLFELSVGRVTGAQAWLTMLYALEVAHG